MIKKNRGEFFGNIYAFVLFLVFIIGVAMYLAAYWVLTALATARYALKKIFQWLIIR